jgi:hypothetical protein
MKYIALLSLATLSSCSLAPIFEKEIENEVEHEVLHIACEEEDPYEDEAYRQIMEEYYRYHFTEYLSIM